MKANRHILICCLLIVSFAGIGQINTFSPYSRYGLGELSSSTFAHNTAMGGAYIALKPDSTMPIFINAGNPAAYALIKLTCLEVGGNGTFSKFTTDNVSINKHTANFAYGALGFPVKHNGGACFGIMPFSNVGYNLQNTATEPGIGAVQYLYNGSGGLNKAFLGYGVMPFGKRIGKFKRNNLFVPDSLRRLKGFGYKLAELGNELLTDLSVGFNANYIFGTMENTTQVVYPNSVLYNNTYRDRSLTMGDFTGNFGLQTAMTIDSVTDRKGRHLAIRRHMEAFKTLHHFTIAELKTKNDSLQAAIPLRKRKLNEKVKVTFGYFMNLNNALKASYNTTVYNYILDGTGSSIIRDTVLYKNQQNSTVRLPLEQGLGIGIKKGERINAVADFAITNWQTYRYLNSVNDLKNSYRIAAGINYVPEKYASGNNALVRRVNYRLGVSYQTGYISLDNSLISNYAVTAGVGLPVGIGRLSSMVNLSVQVGQMGPANNELTKEKYIRFTIGFTFCDRWFQKFKYD